MENSGKKYQIDTEENKMFLGELQKNLLNLEKDFYHREEVLISLGMMDTMERQKQRNMDHMPYGPCI